MLPNPTQWNFPYFSYVKIVVLDGYTVNPGDLSWQPILELGEVEIFDRSAPEEIVERARDAQVVVVNKINVLEKHIAQLPHLELICLLATGFDNVDIAAAKNHGVQVYNAVGYGVESVAQHTLALMLALTNRVESHHWSTQNGDWSAQPDFSYSLLTVHELKDKVLGIIGLGQIGARVADLAIAFGMKVLTPKRATVRHPNISMVDLDELFKHSDIITLHVPLTSDTKGLINSENLAKMKTTALLINTGRGGLIIEEDLISAVYRKEIAGAALDVLSLEPPRDKNRLLHLDNVIITPHMAWRSKEARSALVNIVAENIQTYQEQGLSSNRVV